MLASPTLNSATNALRILSNGAATGANMAKTSQVAATGTNPVSAGPKVPAYAQRWVSAYDTATRITLSLDAAEKL